MSGDNALIFDRVSVRFPGAPNNNWAVRDVSFGLSRGEFVSLIGPSGCGKTTLLKLAAGLLQPSSGCVTLDGKPISGPGPERGVVFQEYGVFPWLNVRKNIEFGLRLAANKDSAAADAETVDRYLHLMGLEEFQHALPHTLSGGMRQRVALARSYAVNPRFLLMDEPFGALDSQTRQVMQDLLLQLQQREQKTVLMITHSVEEALYLSSRVVLVSARPAGIKEIIDVPFGYPRDERLLSAPEFTALQARIRNSVMTEYIDQQNRDRSNRHITERTQ